jgi:hypothetical protein
VGSEPVWTLWIREKLLACAEIPTPDRPARRYLTELFELLCEDCIWEREKDERSFVQQFTVQ